MALRSILLEARLTLPPDQYNSNLEWLVSQTELGFHQKSASVGRGLLFVNVYGEAAPLETELPWIEARLLAGRETIIRHLAGRREVSIRFLAGERDKFVQSLDAIESEVGESHWSLGLRLAGLQAFDGIEVQKNYLGELRKRSRAGLTAAYAFFTSMRNEPSVSLPWFVGDIKRRGFSKTYPEHKTYLHFALLGEVPASMAEVATVLRVEQGNSDVDLYETVVAVLQDLALRKLPSSIESAVRKLARSLGQSIFDPRMVKICSVYEEYGPSPTASDESHLHGLLTGAVTVVERLCPVKFSDDPAFALWAAVKSAATGAKNDDKEEGNCPLKAIHTRLQILCGRFAGFDDARHSLSKDARNHYGLCHGRFLADVCTAIAEPTVNDLFDRLSPVALSTSRLGVFDYLLARRLGRNGHGDKSVISSQFIDAFYDGSSVEGLCPKAVEVSRLRSSIRSGNAESLYEFFGHWIGEGSTFGGNWSRVAALELYVSNNDIQSSINLIGNWYASSNSDEAPLPIDSALERVRVADLARLDREISLPLAFEAWRKTADNDTKRRFVRMAFNQFMKGSGTKVPSEFPLAILESDRQRYIAFLATVCVDDIMDMNEAFSSSHKLLVERRSICVLLRNLDPANSSAYDDEILSITKSLSIWEGLKVVDGSRIHVDETGFSKAVRTELQGSFDRYASLVRSGVGVAENFDTVLRNLRQGGYAEGLTIPANEADDLLTSMVLRMKAMFLGNNIYGLHGFLSKRIRHGSLVGRLRGPSERHKLITRRASDTGQYEQNDYWLQRVGTLDANQRSRLEKALEDFSKAFDRELRTLKDERLQVRADDRTSGIFDFNVNAPMLSVIRSSIKQDLTIEGFIRATFVSFWAYLKSPLEEAQKLIKTNFQERSSEKFHRLSMAASACIDQEATASEFFSAVRAAHEETQVQVKTVASWFERSADSNDDRRYTLDDAVSIGVKSAKLAFADFNPYIVQKCDDLTMPSASLQFVADALFVALGNIAKYSEMGPEPTIGVDARITDEGESLTFAVRSKIASGVRTCETEYKLQKIREQIDCRDYENAVGSEGNSGLLKLASIAHQSDIGGIKFGFVGDDEFELVLTYSLVLHANEGAAAMESVS